MEVKLSISADAGQLAKFKFEVDGTECSYFETSRKMTQTVNETASGIFSHGPVTFYKENREFVRVCFEESIDPIMMGANKCLHELAKRADLVYNEFRKKYPARNESAVLNYEPIPAPESVTYWGRDEK